MLNRVTAFSARTYVLIGGSVLLGGGLIIGFNFYKLPPEIPMVEIADEELIIPAPQFLRHTVLGQSTEQRDIEVFEFGNGPITILMVGGVHGGYEWNSVILAQTMIEHFTENPDLIPNNLTISIIPVLNPDGLAVVTGGQTKNLTAQLVTNWNADGRGRFNANGVDLNRNFACKWQTTASWRNTPTKAGSTAFSEPEAVILRDYVLAEKPQAVVFWHSVAGVVYASECENGVLSTTLAIMDIYAKASNYQSVPTFDVYPVTGDAEGWLAKIGIPAITVELETRNSIEWQRNLAGTIALLEFFAG